MIESICIAAEERTFEMFWQSKSQGRQFELLQNECLSCRCSLLSPCKPVP